MSIFSQYPENRLLLSCARLSIDDILKDEIKRLLKSDLNWDYIVRNARQNYVASLLSSNLRKLGENEVPKNVLNRLQQICMITTARNMRFHDELTKILRVFERKGIKVILLKGAALIQTLYRNMSLRPMCDIDILVQEKDFGEIRSSLHDLGYELQKTLPDLTGRELVEYAHYFEVIVFDNKGRVSIDTHFRLLDMGIPSIDDHLVWERAIPIRIGNTCALIPSPEDMLLHLCFHANHHQFSKMYYFCDISEVLKCYADGFDWEYLLQIVERRKIKTSIYYALQYTKELLHIDIPLNILNKFKPNYPRRKLFECLWEKVIVRHQGRVRFGRLAGPIYYLLEIDRAKDKLLFVFRGLFPPVQWLSHHFGLPESKRLYFKYLISILKNLHVR